MPSSSDSGDRPDIATFGRTLTVAGYQITDFDRRENYAYCHCDWLDPFGLTVRYLIALTDAQRFDPAERESLTREAQADNRTPLLIAGEPDTSVVAWRDFVQVLGGAVPSWRALTDSFASEIQVLAANQLPPGSSGQAWFLFEEAVCGGLEFLFGRRVRRLGGSFRGRDLPDAIAQSSDGAIVIVDAKASTSPFEVDLTTIRALRDYVERQGVAQRNGMGPASALLVAADYKQGDTTLMDSCNRFLSDTRIPLALLRVTSLLAMIDLTRDVALLRNRIQWRRIFCRNGVIDETLLKTEIESVQRLHI